MNVWSNKTLGLIHSKNYLDQLQEIYPHEEGERKIKQSVIDSIVTAFKNKDEKLLLNKLLNLEKFPYKDSYVAFLRKERSAIDRNPNTVKRICGRLYSMGLDSVIAGVTQPKEANMRRGNQFSDWVKAKFISVDMDEFKSSKKGIVLLDASELEARNFCNKELGIGISKRPDLVAKTGTKYVVGEAKFLSSSGGNQGRAFEDGIGLATNSSGSAYKIFVLDGVHWIETGSDEYKRIDHSNAAIFSALLLYDFLKWRK